MSYCRWSSMNGACEVYAYESDAGWVIHLAARKRKHQDKMPPDPFEALMDENVEEYLKRHKVQQEWMETPEGNEFINIEKEHVGESFCLGDLESFKEKLLYLRNLGWVFPDYVIENVNEEIQEESVA